MSAKQCRASLLLSMSVEGSASPQSTYLLSAGVKMERAASWDLLYIGAFMKRPKPSLTENKMLILYAFSRMGGLTNSQALRFFIENDLIDYIDIQLSLAELLSGKLLFTEQEPLGATYYLTELGFDAVEYFYTTIPASRRDAVDTLAPQWRATFAHESQIFANYAKTATGDYMVHLAAREDHALLFEMNISVPTLSQAKQLCEKWNADSTQLYGRIMDMLTE